MLDDITTAALTAALDLCDLVQASAQTERSVLQEADRCRRGVMIALCKDGMQPDEWEPLR